MLRFFVTHYIVRYMFSFFLFSFSWTCVTNMRRSKQFSKTRQEKKNHKKNIMKIHHKISLNFALFLSLNRWVLIRSTKREMNNCHFLDAHIKKNKQKNTHAKHAISEEKQTQHYILGSQNKRDRMKSKAVFLFFFCPLF